MRREYLIGGVAVLGIIIAGYFFITRNNSSTNEVTGDPYQNQNELPSMERNPSGELGANSPVPQAKTSDAFGVLANNQVLDYFIDTQNAIFLIEPGGHVVKITDGTQTVLSSTDIQNVMTAAFSFDGKKILVVFGNPAKPQVSVFDVTAKTWAPLSTEMKNPVWSPVDYQVAFFSAKDPTISVLATLDLRTPKTATARPVLALHAQDLEVSWPTKDTLYIFEKPSAFTEGSLSRVNIKTKSISLVFEQIAGLMTAWSGDRGIAFFGAAGANRGGQLNLIDGAGKILNNFELVTLPTKCAFEKESRPPAPSAPKNTKPTETEFLVCGFPQSAQSFRLAPQPDAYLQKDFWSSDYFYKINLQDGTIQNLLPESDFIFDATNLSVFNKNLFFVNRYDKRLYTIALPTK